MNRIVLLDAGPLGMYANPGANPKNRECKKRVEDLLTSGGAQVKAPGIAVYENRRKLVHLQLKQPAPNRLTRFDSAVAILGILPLTDAVLQRATEVWGSARHKGITTASPDSIDGDVILVAQAWLDAETGNQVEIATTNSKDLLPLIQQVLNWDANRVLNWDDLKK